MEITASFYIAGATANTLTIFLNADARYPYYRIFVRRTDNQNDVSYDSGFFYFENSDWIEVPPVTSPYYPLQPNTNYTINVAYSPDGTAESANWLGAVTHNTAAQETNYYAYMSFNDNGGSGGPGLVLAGPSLYLPIFAQIPMVIPVREKHRFGGWLYGGMIYQAGSIIELPQGALGLTGQLPVYVIVAIWEMVRDGGGIYIQDEYYEPWIYTTQWNKYEAYIESGGEMKKTAAKQ